MSGLYNRYCRGGNERRAPLLQALGSFGIDGGQGMKVAILGGTGLIGRHVIEALATRGADRIVATYHRRPAYHDARVEWVSCDLRRPGAAAALLEDADAAVLCAGQLATSGVLKADPVTPVLDTLRIVTNALEAASAAQLGRLVMLSSCTIYPTLGRALTEADAMVGNPPAQWFGVGWMHRYAEHQLRWHVETLGRIGRGVVLRPTLVYGRYDDFSEQSGHFVPAMVARIANRQKPIEIWGDGEQSRNLLHAADLARAVLIALEHEFGAYADFNLSSAVEASVNAVVRELVDLDGFSDADIRHDLTRGGGPASLSVSSAAFQAATGWRAEKSLRDGLAEVLDWYKRVEMTKG